MRHNSPLQIATALLLGLLFALSGHALAQPGPPGGNAPPDNPEPPAWAGPPNEPGPPPHAGDNGDDDEDDEEDDEGVPDFCSSGPNPGGPNGQSGLSSIAHLNFSQTDPDTGGEPEDGSWGRMTYRWIAPVFDYVFNGHALPEGADYTLTYQPEPFPSDGVICLGTGTVNEEGDLHLEDAFNLDTDLPAAYDENEDEATLALVIAADVDCEAGTMNNWDEDAYVFAEEGMFYVDSDLEEEDEEEDDGDGGED